MVRSTPSATTCARFEEDPLTKSLWTLFVVSLAALPLAACSTAPRTLELKTDLEWRARAALSAAQAENPAFYESVKVAEACAVFPEVGKGGLVVGGAYGKGVLYEHGRLTGYCDMSQASLGFMFGGQGYTEIICLQTPSALARFRDGVYSLNAQSNAIAFALGSSTQGRYSADMSLLIFDEAGLMVEASIGVQEFRFEPLPMPEAR